MEKDIKLGVIEAITLKVVVCRVLKIKVGKLVLHTEVLEECSSGLIIWINITVPPDVYGTGIFFIDHGYCCFKSCKSCNELGLLTTCW